ncbi:MAG: superoxide dismutase [Flavobacteriales bacterium AspAUS03]
MLFQLPELPYSYDALEPYIDACTMEIHYTKHHAAYTNNLNKTIEGTDLENQSIEDILKKSIGKSTIRNNGGGFYNHNLFWQILGPKKGGKPSGTLAKAIDEAFGSFEDFKKEFSNIAATRFGSGWAWLCVKDRNLIVGSTANQDNPLMTNLEFEGFPILGLDVWEHAYYLKYQNRRPEYIETFWKVVNWDKVAENYEKA